jgi:FHS family L-fucose permease-like MFS transporter
MQKSNPSVFSVLVSVFFFWGFVAANNDILIPVFKEALDLKNWQSQMINFAFYFAYTIGAFLYMIHGTATKRDIVARIGYQNSIGAGLLLSALGTLLFIPAATYNSFFIMITALFVVGLGFALQQTAANPFAIALGNPEGGSQRLSLAGGINNIGTTIGPLILAFAIFGSVKDVPEVTEVSINSVKMPYLYLGIAFAGVAILFFLSGKKKSYYPGESEQTKIEVMSDHSLVDTSSKDESVFEETNKNSEVSLFQFPQLYLGMIGIFSYVGVEVATAGNLGAYIKEEVKGMEEGNIAPFVALYWASLMIGRWASSASVFTSNRNYRYFLKVLLPFIAFGVFLLATKIAGYDVTSFYAYVFVIPLLIIADVLSKDDPAKQLLIFSILGIVALIFGMLTTGIVSVFGFISVGLFCSTLWPCVFTLSTRGLGDYTSKGSSLLIMMIMGGAFLSLLQGIIADTNTFGIRYSFIVGVVCFMYLAFYALKMKTIIGKSF